MAVPRWFNRIVVALVAVLVGYGTVGLVLALDGRSTPVLVGIAGTLLTLGLLRIGWPVGPAHHDGGHGTWWAAAALVVALASAWVNASHASEHVIVNRDPGVYLVTGRWVADHGDLVVDAARGPFATADGIELESAGTYEESDGRLDLQFTHLLPVLLAEAFWLGGSDLMVILPALIGSAALLTTYALAVRLCGRHWAGLLVTCTLAVCLPVLAAVRDTYSEGLTWLLLTGGLWLWMRATDEGRAPVALLGGLALGAMTAARIDAVVYLLPIPAVAGLMVARSGPDDRRLTRQTANAFVAGLVPGVALAAIDVLLRSREYYRDLDDNINALWVGFAVSLAVGWAVRTDVARRVVSRTRGLGAWAVRRRRALATCGASAVVVAMTLAWLVRPHLQVAKATMPSQYISAIQLGEGGPAEAGRSYAEMSLRWVEWYVGAATTGLAIIGGAVVAHRTIGRRGALPPVLPWLALAGGTLLYLWRPNISPDQIWATRRLVPAALPLVVMLAAVAAVSAVSLVRQRWPGQHVLAAVAAGAMALVVWGPTAARAAPASRLSDQHGYMDLVRDLCPQVRGGAVLTLEGERAGIALPQTLRSFCDVPVASVVEDTTAAQVRALADAWAAEGCALRVLTASVDPIHRLLPAVRPTRLGPYTSDRALEVTVSRPPRRLVDVSDEMYVATVPTGSGHLPADRDAPSRCRA